MVRLFNSQINLKVYPKLGTLVYIIENVNLRMKGVKPSASSGSHNSFIKPLASSLVSFSPVKMVANGDIDMSQILPTYVSIKLTQVGQQPEEIFAKHGLV